MRITAILPGVVILVALAGGCDDRDFASLTQADELGSFEVEATLAAADGALVSRAKRYGLEVHRDPKSGQHTSPSDYVATVSQGRCLLTVDGFRSITSSRVKVWLGEARRSACKKDMRALYVGLRDDLQTERK